MLISGQKVNFFLVFNLNSPVNWIYLYWGIFFDKLSSDVLVYGLVFVLTTDMLLLVHYLSYGIGIEHFLDLGEFGSKQLTWLNLILVGVL